MNQEEAENKPEGWEPISKALANLPTPAANNLFVQKVMVRVRDEERKLSWRELWKIPAFGFGFTSVLLAIITLVGEPSRSLENFLLAEVRDPVVSEWMTQTERPIDPTPDQVLEFAMEDL